MQKKTPGRPAKTTTNSGADQEREEIITANKDLFEGNQKLEEENKALLAQLAEARALAAKAIPVATPARHDASEVDQVDKGSADFSEDGEFIKPVTGELSEPQMKEKLAMEAFMTDMVTVNIQGSADHRHSKVFSISVNEATEIFKTGETKTVQRKFVEGLCRAKNTAYTNREVSDGKGGTKFVYDPRSGLRYNFSVMNDPHPRGASWLEHTLRQP